MRVTGKAARKVATVEIGLITERRGNERLKIETREEKETRKAGGRKQENQCVTIQNISSLRFFNEKGAGI